MIFQIIEYLKFLAKSSSQHGIHSPFVYQIITQCFYNNTKYADYQIIKNYKQELLNNKSNIQVTDLGAGSRVMRSNIRKVSAIAKNAGSTQNRCELLYKLTKHFQPKTILELGTSLGLGTLSLQLGAPNAKVTTIEGCPETSKFTQKKLEAHSSNIDFKTGDFKEIINKLQTPKYDFIYIDGNHTKEATLNYFNLLLPYTHNDTIILFDDIYWSKGMVQAWNEITKNQNITISINGFYCGLISFRKEQGKQHFNIRLKRFIRTKLLN